MADFYCSQKFWWLSIEPERRTIGSCCAATTSKIDLTWLKNNPGELFNTPELKQERQMMLANKPVASCEATCWQAERNGIPSRRTIFGSDTPTHTEIQAAPELINIIVGSHCNLTCSYCSKQNSTAWLHDINDNGPYLDEPRYQINTNDHIVLKLGQSKIKVSEPYQQIINSVKALRGSLKQIEISGGEPFLYNGLTDLVSSFDHPVEVWTGLGVNTARLSKILDELPPETTFTISAENVGKQYEFNRFGNSWENFLRNFELVNRRFNYRFCNVLSNLTVHGFEQFQTEFGTGHDVIQVCNDPDYLNANVIDANSKSAFLAHTYKYHDREIKQTVGIPHTAEQEQNFKKYVTEFAKRRGLSMEIFPDNFVTWFNSL